MAARESHRTTTRHPRAHLLLALLDGELDDATNREIARHLERCWQCRKRQRELERAIDSFVSVRAASLAPPRDDLARNRLRHRLADLGQRVPPATSHRGVLRLRERFGQLFALPRLVASAAGAGMVVVAMAAATLLPSSAPPTAVTPLRQVVAERPPTASTDETGIVSNPAPTIVAASSRAVPLAWAHTPATVEEVSVAVALHDADACLGEEIRLFPVSDGTLLVHGLVDDAARRDALVARVKRERVPVRIELYTQNDNLSGVEWYPSPDGDLGPEVFASAKVVASSAGVMLSAPRLPDGSVPVSASVRARLIAEGESDPDAAIARLADDMLTASRQIVLHAWAIVRHETEFSTERTGALSSSAKAAARQLIDSHEHALDLHQRAIATHLADTGLLPRSHEQVASVTAILPRQRLRDAVEEYRLVSHLFTATSDASSVDSALTRLAELLASIRQR